MEPRPDTGVAEGPVNSGCRRTTPADITAAVLASFDLCPDDRLREVLTTLVRHVHGFVTEVGLTQSEWGEAVRVLTETGHITDDHRQEFILWSDSLGVSMLVDALEHEDEGVTESTVLGPFYVPGAPARDYGTSIADEPGGTPVWVHGYVRCPDGSPIPDAELDIWQNGPNQLYAVQDADAPETHLRGRFTSREDGSYAFLGVLPVPYPIPADGPVGAMLAASGRHPWRPAHIHMIVRAPGFRSVATHVFDAASDYLESDAVFAVKPSLLREFVPRAADDPDRPADVAGAWYSVRNDIVLAPASSPGEPGDFGRTA
jgi:hydroxyquinol 1,2-dioxygenase